MGFLLILSVVYLQFSTGFSVSDFIASAFPFANSTPGQEDIPGNVETEVGEPVQSDAPASPDSPVPAEVDTPASSSDTDASVSPTPPTERVPIVPSAGPLLMTPFGGANIYLLHQVREAESLTFIANLYATTVEVLRLTNDIQEGTTLWVGRILVVMPGRVTSQGLQTLQALQFESEISLEDLIDTTVVIYI